MARVPLVLLYDNDKLTANVHKCMVGNGNSTKRVKAVNCTWNVIIRHMVKQNHVGASHGKGTDITHDPQ